MPLRVEYRDAAVVRLVELGHTATGVDAETVARIGQSKVTGTTTPVSAEPNGASAATLPKRTVGLVPGWWTGSRGRAPIIRLVLLPHVAQPPTASVRGAPAGLA
jgi:hypothetical protein